MPLSRQYVIIAPKSVRPHTIFRVHVTLFRMSASNIRVRASLSSQGEEYATTDVNFNQPATKSIELEVSIIVNNLHVLGWN